MDQSKLAKLKLAREKYRQASSEKQHDIAELEMTDISKGVRYVKFLVMIWTSANAVGIQR